MKKFINNVDDIVNEMVEGIALANPELVTKLDGYEVLIRNKNINKDKVSLVSGGGSGHEPTHAGYVGLGMLDAAVCGPVFTSPTPDQILAAIKAVSNKNGVLLIIKNYTGDVMNFQMAEQMAQMEGIEVDHVIVDDDIALENSTFTTGKRGIAGTVLVHKLVGAKAETGVSLQELKTYAEDVIKNVASFGIGLNGATVPANGKRGFELDDDTAEIGLGIHGEPGIRQEKMKTADEFTDEIMQPIMEELKLKSGDKVALLVNGLGATPLMELNIIARRAINNLKAKGIQIEFTLVGDYLTAIDMPGMSISIAKLNEETAKLIKAKAETIGLKVF